MSPTSYRPSHKDIGGKDFFYFFNRDGSILASRPEFNTFYANDGPREERDSYENTF
jgi:hypothetical protein